MAKIYQARIIRLGVLEDFTTDIYDYVHAIIDRKKVSATLLLRAIGYSSNREIFMFFADGNF